MKVAQRSRRRDEFRHFLATGMHERGVEALVKGLHKLDMNGKEPLVSTKGYGGAGGHRQHDMRRI